MQEGKEPLRTFSDLMQFYKTQEEPEVAAAKEESADRSQGAEDAGAES